MWFQLWEFAFNITVWILAENYIVFSISADLIRLYLRCQLISCAAKGSACRDILHANYESIKWEIPAIIALKSNVKSANPVLRFVVNIFYCDKTEYTALKHADTKGEW